MKTTQTNDLLKHLGVKNASAIGHRVAHLLNAWQGLHHLNLDKVDWSGSYVQITFSQPLDSFDFDRLTKLCFLAHDHCIRVQVTGKPGPSRDVYIMFHGRDREGVFSQRHPTIEVALEMHRKAFPISTNDMP